MAPFILINKLNGAKRSTGSRETNSPPFTERVHKSSTGQHPEIVKPVRTNPGRLHFAVASTTRGSSVRKLVHVTLLTPTILRWVPHFFLKIGAPHTRTPYIIPCSTIHAQTSTLSPSYTSASNFICNTQF